jgi:hypothetical protein
MDRRRDPVVDGVYYDLGTVEPLPPGGSVVLPVSAPFPATGLGVALAGDGGNQPSGGVAIEAVGRPATARATVAPGVGQHLSTDTDPGGIWLGRAAFDRPSVVTSVRVTWSGSSPAVLRALTLIDARTGRDVPIVVNPLYQIDYLGDLKIYRDTATLPRAFLADGLVTVANVDAQVAQLAQPDWDPLQAAVAVSGEVDPRRDFAASGDPGQARIGVDEPERVVVETNASGPRTLVLTDSYYPGWNVTVDGRDASILPVDLLFRGVVLPPGQHQVVFSYQPASWRIGLVLCAIGIALLATGLIGPAFRRGRRSSRLM